MKVYKMNKGYLDDDFIKCMLETLEDIFDDIEYKEPKTHKKPKIKCEKYIPKKDFGIKKVMFNKPATIIFWKDGTKSISVCDKYDTYDKEKGFLIAYLKHRMGGQNYRELMERWVWNDKESK